MSMLNKVRSRLDSARISLLNLRPQCRSARYSTGLAEVIRKVEAAMDYADVQIADGRVTAEPSWRMTDNELLLQEKEFEAWAKVRCLDVARSAGRYVDAATMHAWAGWIARHCLPVAAPQ